MICSFVVLAGCAWPRTELFEGVPQSEAGNTSIYSEDRPTNVLLRNRVQQRFPVGSSEQPLLDWLSKQEVKIDRQAKNDGGFSGWASRRLGTWPCDRSVQVIWEVSSTGAIQKITASEGDTGCL